MISKETRIEEILNNSPEKVKVFVQMGVPCLVCGESFWGTVEELCKRYNVDVDLLLKKLNDT